MAIENDVAIFSYEQFTQYITELTLDGRTSGAAQSPRLIEDTLVNRVIMNVLYDTVSIKPTVKKIISEANAVQNWYLIVEAWCADTAHNLPVIARMAQQSKGRIILNILLRDENLDFIDQYQTNGARAIPKLISFDHNGNELFTWGPRPVPAQCMLLDWKRDSRGKSFEEFKVSLYEWYRCDGGNSLQYELVHLFAGRAIAASKRA